MADDTETLLDATTALVGPLLTALEALTRVGRHLHPPDVAELAGALAGYRAPLEAGRSRFAAVAWPVRLQRFAAHASSAADHALEALTRLEVCASRPNPVLDAYRALGFATRAVEALYPVAFMLPPVNRFFLDAPQRSDEAFQARLMAAAADREDVGVLHADNAAEQRGGFSLYVPEYYRSDAAMPLVVALHGGSGHGRSFLWTWLREARSRGALVLAPTSGDATWSLMAPESDVANLVAMVAYVGERWSVDPARVLLTGMSDGGTFSYLAGLQAGVPFTHLAPVSATFHPMLLAAASRSLAGLPVYLVHGGLDWMFPVADARMAREALIAAGARVCYRELPDLSHTYPREENLRMLDWLRDEPGVAG